MIKGFWKDLPRPFFALAPMADVTDESFRFIIAEYGKPDVMWTEFVAADGLMSRGREKLMRFLDFDKSERPIVAQLFGSNPEKMVAAARLVQDLGFDGLDLNMGCPDRKVEKQNAGAALIKNPQVAQMIIRAAKEGANKIPVSVKTRVGYNAVSLDSWLPYILEESPAAITIHGRTRKEMSKVPANWDLIAQSVEIAEKLCGENRPLMLGNGDVRDLADAMAKAKKYGVDGVMIGRGIFGNPWLFKDADKIRKSKNPGLLVQAKIPVSEKLRVLLEHTKLFEKKFGNKHFAVMKKHYKAYANGFDGAKELREHLMLTKSAAEVEKLLENLQAN